MASRSWWENTEEKRRRPRWRGLPFTLPTSRTTSSTTGRLEQCKKGRRESETASCPEKKREAVGFNVIVEWGCGLFAAA